MSIDVTLLQPPPPPPPTVEIYGAVTVAAARTRGIAEGVTGKGEMIEGRSRKRKKEGGKERKRERDTRETRAGKRRRGSDGKEDGASVVDERMREKKIKK